MTELQREPSFPVLPYSSAMGKQNYEFENTHVEEVSVEEAWPLLA